MQPELTSVQPELASVQAREDKRWMILEGVASQKCAAYPWLISLAPGVVFLKFADKDRAWPQSGQMSIANHCKRCQRSVGAGSALVWFCNANC